MSVHPVLYGSISYAYIIKPFGIHRRANRDGQQPPYLSDHESITASQYLQTSAELVEGSIVAMIAVCVVIRAYPCVPYCLHKI